MHTAKNTFCMFSLSFPRFYDRKIGVERKKSGKLQRKFHFRLKILEIREKNNTFELCTEFVESLWKKLLR